MLFACCYFYLHAPILFTCHDLYLRPLIFLCMSLFFFACLHFYWQGVICIIDDMQLWRAIMHRLVVEVPPPLPPGQMPALALQPDPRQGCPVPALEQSHSTGPGGYSQKQKAAGLEGTFWDQLAQPSAWRKPLPRCGTGDRARWTVVYCLWSTAGLMVWPSKLQFWCSHMFHSKMGPFGSTWALLQTRKHGLNFKLHAQGPLK